MASARCQSCGMGESRSIVAAMLFMTATLTGELPQWAGEPAGQHRVHLQHGVQQRLGDHPEGAPQLTRIPGRDLERGVGAAVAQMDPRLGADALGRQLLAREFGAALRGELLDEQGIALRPPEDLVDGARAGLRTQQRGKDLTGAVAVEPPEIDETWDLLATLPRDQRVALVLRYYEDLPVDEIARIMECRPATARTRIHRALAKLREEMTP